MDRLFRNWIIALIVGSTVGMVLFLAGLIPILKAGEMPALSSVFLCLVASFVLTVCGQHWARIFRGKIVFSKNQTATLNGGELVVPVPGGPFEVWIFCRVPFAQYNGEVSITLGNGNKHLIKVPRRNPFFYPVRSNLVPLIWHSQQNETNTQGQCSVAFHLLPTFAETAYDRRVHKNNEESVSVLIKASRCRGLHTARATS